MPFDLDLSLEAEAVIRALESDPGNAAKLRKVRKALALLQSNPRHPGLNVHRYVSKAGPGGEPLWEAYVENRTPGAWRMWWWYGPGRNVITVLTIGPHPD